MAIVVFGMTMSLDGFVADSSGSVARLYPDFAALHDTELLAEAMRDTGAVVMGRHSYEMANRDFTGYEFQTPIFVITHEPPETVAKGENENLEFHFVSDGVESAITQAKAAAGEKTVTVVGGPDTGRQLLQDGLVDMLQVSIMPVLLGDGLRLFQELGIEPVELELTRVIRSGNRTDLEFRVTK